MRLNKYISETGICSRREADQWIEQGRVTVNQAPAQLGTQVKDGDEVRINGKLLGEKKKDVYIALNKPVGITCTTERHVEGNIVDFIGHRHRIFPIGRLDKDSEGLILLTNNGDIVNQILRSEHNHEKEYVVSVDRLVTPEFISGMSQGVHILDAVTKPCRVRQISKNSFNIVLTQGLNRQIRRMCEAFDYKVRSLKRIRIMNVRLDGIAVGTWRDLSPVELQGLLPQLGTQQVAAPQVAPRPVLSLRPKNHPPRNSQR